MRNGFTTGSCAAAATKAAAYMLFSGQIQNSIEILTPAGSVFNAQVVGAEIGVGFALCGIVKDAGDDPDVTNGITIYSRVSYIDGQADSIHLTGGPGIGRVTKPGLEMPVGEFAINSVPRQMIKDELAQAMDCWEVHSAVQVEIFAPEGIEIAQKTFNPHMGIEGGISILGTSGIVTPMSSEALIKTIELDLKQRRALGNEVAVMVPGNYGQTFLVNNYALDRDSIVHFSNYMGIGIDLAVQQGFEKILVVGHTGKLVKVSGGIMNTHSKEADSRLELMAAALVDACYSNSISLDMAIVLNILNSVTTTAALEILQDAGLLEITCNRLLEKILYHLRKRAGDGIQVECILYENSFGLLAKSEFAEDLL